MTDGDSVRPLLLWLLRGSTIVGVPLAVAGAITAVLAIVWPGLWTHPRSAAVVGGWLAVIGSVPGLLLVGREFLVTPATTDQPN